MGTALGLCEAQRQTVLAESNLITAEENHELARQTVACGSSSDANGAPAILTLNKEADAALDPDPSEF